jgi:hypothetical protein
MLPAVFRRLSTSFGMFKMDCGPLYICLRLPLPVPLVPVPYSLSTMLEADKNVYRAVSLVSYSSIFPLDLQKRYAASRTNLLCPKREKSASCSLSSTPDHGIELAISAVLIPNSQCKSFTPTRTNSTTYLYHNCSHGVKLTTSNLCSSLPLLSARTLLATCLLAGSWCYCCLQ